jgi:hypothetical protein
MTNLSPVSDVTPSLRPLFSNKPSSLLHKKGFFTLRKLLVYRSSPSTFLRKVDKNEASELWTNDKLHVERNGKQGRKRLRPNHGS